jgi:hypothetical protein
MLDGKGTVSPDAEKVDERFKSVPQGLKPRIVSSSCGTAKAVPFQQNRIFQQPVQPCPSHQAFLGGL